MGLLTLVMALAISGVAAWYSIVGLMAIFSGAQLAIAIMGSVLECGKLVTASWLYRNWKQCPILLKSYLTVAVVVLMLITSMGIFGFLSKAHLEQTMSLGGTSEIKIGNLEAQLKSHRRTITTAETALGQLEQTVQTLIDYDRIRGPEGALAVRQSQKEERDALNREISDAYGEIESIEAKMLPLKEQALEIQVEVGPLAYIADAIYGEQGSNNLDQAVRWVIYVIIFVFDPLAVLLLIAANMTLNQPKKITHRVEKIEAAVMNDVDQKIDDIVEIEIDQNINDMVEVELAGENTFNVSSDTFQEPNQIPIEQISSRELLKHKLNDVDKKLIELYTHRNTIEHKQEKRALQRLKKKIIDRINQLTEG